MTRLWALIACIALGLPTSPAQLLADAPAVKALASRAEGRQIEKEDDPEDEAACFSMGRLHITYESGNVGPPGVGLRITDPRGRTIGYDFRGNQGWQEIPLAQASLDCDQNEDTGELRNCKGEIEICGPITGAYQVRVLPTRNGKYSITVSATSQGKTNASDYTMTTSHVELEGEIREYKPALLRLQYSREAGSQITLSGSDEHLTARIKEAAQDATY